ncbi:MAG: DNA-directed RNA polymerase subunit A' [Candidatus Diapherotrites archaeon CG10_big_fil_rev_8_21_14_0_10_31_34]|nr:MAG: DNA-directed RNA polymerase subunit A' [Candidatus Diapherotrites archaeon CG10_big_fil_rev_8_21_14_0_10_31_34]
MLMKKIGGIEFNVMSPELIRKLSALDVKTPDTYDKDGYPMEGGLMDPHLGVINPGLRCKTCGQKMKQCPGHFGTLELVRPVVHSEFGRKVEELLIATCDACGRIAVPEEKLKKWREIDDPTEIKVKRILLRTKKTKKCPHCGTAKKEIMLDKPTNFYLNKERIYPTQIREWLEKIPDQDLVLFGYNTEKIRPEWFVLTVLLIPPITMRPSITLESGIKSEDDLTHKLVDIIRINLRLKDNIDAGAPQLIIEDLWDLLQYHTTTFYDNNTSGVPPAKHRSGRALRTLVQRLKGKKGRFRYNLTGKRVNHAARSTITPDPFISINEIGVPKEIASDLTVPELITEWNKKDIIKLIKDTEEVKYFVRANGARKKVSELTRKEIIEEVETGCKIERQLKDGDIILFNRQPSLHRISMMAHKARIMPGRTFKMNPIVCKPYNADFDGDEMNLHVPQTEEGKTEAIELMYAQNQIISARYGAPVIILDEDGVSGTYILTMDSTKLNREEAMQYFYEMGITELPKPKNGNSWSGKQVFSAMLPKGLNLAYRTNTYKELKKIHPDKDPKELHSDSFLKIEDGELISGVVDEQSLGEGKGELIHALFNEYGAGEVEKFYHKTNRIVGDILTKKGMSVGLDEFETNAEIEKVKAKAIKEELEEAEKLVEQFKKGNLELIPGRTLQESFELRMMRLGAGTKDKVQKEIMKQKVEELLSDNPKYNSTVMIMSGSRGSAINITNIAGLWGQASVREGRPKRGYRNRLISANKENDVGATAGGYIQQNFMQGMKVKEFFYHSMGGRQGEVDTGVSTKVSGYLYRRLANSLKDLNVANDLTTRSANKNIIQFTYGDDGVFPMKTSRGKTINIARELEKLNK